MKTIFELKNAKIALGISILLFSIGIFIENAAVASLSTLKADKAQIELDRVKDYKVEKPLPPIKESKYLIKPAKPPRDASSEDITAYEGKLQKYEQEKKDLTEQYDEKMEDYEEEMQEYETELASLNKDKAMSRNDYKRSLERVKNKIKQKKIDINKIFLPLLLRFLGSLIFFIGFMGILLHGDQYEKLGILVLTGFALKTIIGL